ncbi:hypothetical protein SUGI_0451310 [Cryptomeria japonica]|uniref:late embryogenesis abundant protein At5g17165 n=1 Tax=Cryptomeria japonica TaxID=3369 RepID=UPI002408ED36|nr:late embryogenesis abundant protein At5g17165 [Cryptomeria japonica]GLJ23786.1 hypothetical protein SUGI_0451310 [Cryptomeria japonica]
MALSLLMPGRSLFKACGVIRHSIPASRFSIHSSVYEKNVDEGVDLTRVPEHVTVTTSQKWWAPHPKTGVFGPADEQNWAGGDPCHSHGKKAESSLDQQVWFRPLEDVQRQPSN